MAVVLECAEGPEVALTVVAFAAATKGTARERYVVGRLPLHSRPARPGLRTSIEQRFDILAGSSRLCVAKIAAICVSVVVH